MKAARTIIPTPCSQSHQGIKVVQHVFIYSNPFCVAEFNRSLTFLWKPIFDGNNP